jgi:hypothetical protein
MRCARLLCGVRDPGVTTSTCDHVWNPAELEHARAARRTSVDRLVESAFGGRNRRLDRVARGDRVTVIRARQLGSFGPLICRFSKGIASLDIGPAV